MASGFGAGAIEGAVSGAGGVGSAASPTAGSWASAAWTAACAPLTSGWAGMKWAAFSARLARAATRFVSAAALWLARRGPSVGGGPGWATPGVDGVGVLGA